MHIELFYLHFSTLCSEVLSSLISNLIKTEYKENKEEGRTQNLLDPDNNIEFLKHFTNILLLKVSKY